MINKAAIKQIEFDKFIEKDYLLTKDMPHWIECKLCGNEFDVDKNTKKVYYYQGINQKDN